MTSLFTINWFANNSTVDATGALVPVYKGFLPKWGEIPEQRRAGTLDADGATVTPAPPGRRSERSTTTPSSSRSTAPNAEFLVRLADMANMILPEHILEDATAADVRRPWTSPRARPA